MTVLLQPGDNWMMHVVAEQIRPATSSWPRSPPNAATAASATCWPPVHGARRTRLVIDAGVRDVKTLGEMGFPVWSKAISSKGTIKATLGSVNIPLVCAGAW